MRHLANIVIQLSLYAIIASSLSAETAPWKTEDRYWGNAVSVSEESNIPDFPETLEGFRHRPELDFWGKPYKEINSIRVFSGEDWTNLYPPFPKTMNGCHKGWYVVRWRSQNPNVIIESATGYHGDIRMRQSVAPPATKGIMQGSNCTEPLFKFSRTKNGNSSTLTDVVYEIKFWYAAP